MASSVGAAILGLFLAISSPGLLAQNAFSDMISDLGADLGRKYMLSAMEAQHVKLVHRDFANIKKTGECALYVKRVNDTGQHYYNLFKDTNLGQAAYLNQDLKKN